jgi:hypothetical protein
MKEKSALKSNNKKFAEYPVYSSYEVFHNIVNENLSLMGYD